MTEAMATMTKSPTLSMDRPESGQPPVTAREIEPIEIRHILLPIDFSESSLAAIPYAQTLARSYGAKLTLLHIVVPPPYPDWGYANLAIRDAKLVAAAREKLESIRNQFDRESQSIESLLIRPGEPEVKITDTAAKRQSDLILIPTHGRSAVPHALLGSTAELVVRHAPCPVMTFKRAHLLNSPAPPDIKRILVPVDFSSGSKKALRYAVAMAKKFQASITLLHVVYTTLPANITQAAMMQEYARWENLSEQLLQKMRRTEIPEEMQVETVVRTGSPYYEVTQFAEREQFDLIVLSTHGHSGLKHFLLGSTAERIVQHAGCPVLVVREKEREFLSLENFE